MSHPLSRQNCRPQTGQLFSVDNEEYELGGELGDGAVGIVRRARCLRNNAVRAVKFLAPDTKYIDEAVFDDVVSRFRREGQRTPFLNHNSLLKIYAYAENKDGQAFQTGNPKNPFILMQVVKGRTLESYIRRLARDQEAKGTDRIFSVDLARLSIAIEIANALEYLHKKKLIHRDVKPANIFLPSSEGHSSSKEAILGDFGIMKWGDFQASLTTGTLTTSTQRGLGTLKYMSPEQAVRPKDVTVRTDVYSFGITLFELFTSQILASSHHVFEIYAARMSRGTTMSRFLQMGYQISTADEGLGELILDMHLRGIDGRPSIEKVRGRLTWEYNRIAGGAV